MSVFQLSVHSLHLTAQNDIPGDPISLSHEENRRTLVSWLCKLPSSSSEGKIIKTRKEREEEKKGNVLQHAMTTLRAAGSQGTWGFRPRLDLLGGSRLRFASVSLSYQIPDEKSEEQIERAHGCYLLRFLTHITKNS